MHSRFVTFQSAETAIPERPIADVLRLAVELWPTPVPMQTDVVMKPRYRSTGRDYPHEEKNVIWAAKADLSQPWPDRPPWRPVIVLRSSDW